jgi:hypothetical protein
MEAAVASTAAAGTRRASARRVFSWFLFATALSLALASAVYVRMNILVSNVLFVDWFTYAQTVDRMLRGAPLYAPQQLAGPYQLPDVSGAGFAAVLRREFGKLDPACLALWPRTCPSAWGSRP